MGRSKRIAKSDPHAAACAALRKIQDDLGWPITFPGDVTHDCDAIRRRPAGQAFAWAIWPGGTWIEFASDGTKPQRSMRAVRDSIEPERSPVIGGDKVRYYVWDGRALREIVTSSCVVDRSVECDDVLGTISRYPALDRMRGEGATHAHVGPTVVLYFRPSVTDPGAWATCAVRRDDQYADGWCLSGDRTLPDHAEVI